MWETDNLVFFGWEEKINDRGETRRKREREGKGSRLIETRNQSRKQTFFFQIEKKSYDEESTRPELKMIRSLMMTWPKETKRPFLFFYVLLGLGLALPPRSSRTTSAVVVVLRSSRTAK